MLVVVVFVPRRCLDKCIQEYTTLHLFIALCVSHQFVHLPFTLDNLALHSHGSHEDHEGDEGRQEKGRQENGSISTSHEGDEGRHEGQHII